MKATATRVAKRVVAAFALCILFCGSGFGQQTTPPPSRCPVLASLASSKVQNKENKDEENIVIWFWNQGRKTTHGIEFQLTLLDAAGNRYPASHKYIATGDTEPDSGDVVIYSAKDEQQHIGLGWDNIEGVEVYVARIMFADASIWKPNRGVCKTAFINSDYDKEMEKRGKIVEEKMKASRKKWREKWNREHPGHQIPELTTEPKNPSSP